VRRGYKRAIIAIGHKILRTLFFMLKRREHYRDSATDYEALAQLRGFALDFAESKKLLPYESMPGLWITTEIRL
jgi:hypothetical protein